MKRLALFLLLWPALILAAEPIRLPFGLKWAIELRHPLVRQPVIEGDLLYFASGGEVYAYRLESGEKLWTASFDDYLSTPPVIEGESLYIGCANYRLYSLNRRDGKVNWSFATKGYVNSTPAVEGDRVYFGSFDGSWYALDRRDGGLVWKKDLGGWRVGGGIIPGPLIDKDFLYCVNESLLYCLKKEDGQIVWFFDAGSRVESTPCMNEEYIFLATASGVVYGVDKKWGLCQWMAYFPQSIRSDLLLFRDRIFLNADDGRLYTLELKMGGITYSRGWEYNLNQPPHYAGVKPGEGFILTDTGEGLVILNPDTGSPLWKYPKEQPVGGSQRLTTPVVKGNFLVYELGRRLLVFSNQRR